MTVPDLTADELAYKETVWQQVLNLPGLGKLPRAQLDALRAKVFSELDEQIALARREGMTPAELERRRIGAINARIQAEREVLLHGYSMDATAFQTVLGRIFATFDCVPRLDARTLGGERVDNVLFRASSRDWKESRDAQGELVGICDNRAVTMIARTLRENHELLVRCRSIGRSVVRAVGTQHLCERCRALDGQSLPVAKLLADYAAGVVAFPHQIEHPDEAGACPGPKLIAV